MLYQTFKGTRNVDGTTHFRSGPYWIKTNTSHGRSFIYCHMERIQNCENLDGWTLATKLDGNKVRARNCTRERDSGMSMNSMKCWEKTLLRTECRDFQGI